MSSSCVPASTTQPPCTTAMVSAFWIVERRCAMMMLVRPSWALSRASWTTWGAGRRGYNHMTMQLWWTWRDKRFLDYCTRKLVVNSFTRHFPIKSTLASVVFLTIFDSGLNRFCRKVRLCQSSVSSSHLPFRSRYPAQTSPHLTKAHWDFSQELEQSQCAASALRTTEFPLNRPLFDNPSMGKKENK